MDWIKGIKPNSFDNYSYSFTKSNKIASHSHNTHSPVQVQCDLLGCLAGHHAVHLHYVVADAHDLRGLHSNVLRLPLRAAHRLVNHDARVRQRKAAAPGARTEQKGGHGCSQSEVDSYHFGLDVLDRVVDR